MKYFVYTVIDGLIAYVICHDGNGGFTVKDHPADHEVVHMDKEVAERIAEQNTKGGVVYKIKPVPVK